MSSCRHRQQSGFPWSETSLLTFTGEVAKEIKGDQGSVKRCPFREATRDVRESIRRS